MATHSGMFAWRIPWTEEPGGRQYMGSQRVDHNRVTKQLDLLVNDFSFGLSLVSISQFGSLPSISMALPSCSLMRRKALELDRLDSLLSAGSLAMFLNISQSQEESHN